MQHRSRTSPPSTSESNDPAPHNPAPPTATASPSSRAGELGRRLAQERQTNQRLLRRWHESQRRLDELRDGPTTREADRGLYLNHIRELQDALRSEMERRERAERGVAKCFLEHAIGTIAETSDGDGGEDVDRSMVDALHREDDSACGDACGDASIRASELRTADDDRVAHLLERAKNLLSDDDDVNDCGSDDGDGSNSHSNPPLNSSQRYMLTYDPSYRPHATQPTNHGAPLLRDSMKEFQALLEGFYVEQQHRNEMAQTATSHDDVLWLFEELEWRFEEIRRGYEEEWTRWNQDSMPQRQDVSTTKDTTANGVNVDEYKACLRGFMEVLASHRGSVGHAPRDSLDNLRDQVSSLRRQLSSSTSHHERMRRELRREIETMTQNHKSITEEKSKTIEMLEAKVAQQNETIARLEQDGERLEAALDRERQTHHLSKESMMARLHYLEGIVRSIAAERREKNVAPSRGILCPRGDMPSDTVSMECQRAMPTCASPSPLFSNTSLDGLGNNVSREEEEGSSLILCLRQQIEELGTALQQSEEERANAIEEFQSEREKYVEQYREMRDLLNQFLDSDNVNSNGTQKL
ncbi:hypothetical protein ACHAW6_013222 [Cyclotella cf. meneghiniana]